MEFNLLVMKLFIKHILYFGLVLVTNNIHIEPSRKIYLEGLKGSFLDM